eukprot:5748464-Pleurochrysis_carterae.AAC.2
MNFCHGNSLGEVRNRIFAAGESLQRGNKRFLLMKVVQHRFHQRKLRRFRGRSLQENGHQTAERNNARARARRRSRRMRGALQHAVSSQHLHVQRVGVPSQAQTAMEDLGLTTNANALHISGEVSSGIVIIFSTSWKGEVQPPPFKVDKPNAVGFLSAVLASAVGTKIQHSMAITDAVVVQNNLFVLERQGL